MTLKTPFPPYRLLEVMKIRSAVAENGCLIFMHYRCGGRKKKQKKNRKKHKQLEVHGRARRETARRRNTERTVNLAIRNCSPNNATCQMTPKTVL